MQYSDLRSDVYFLCNTTSASYATADVLRNINRAYNEVTYIIWDSQDAWRFDDRNNTDLPYFRKDLTHGIQDYTIPSTLQKIERIEVLDNNNNWCRINPFDDPDVESALPEYLEVSNLPIKYTLQGNLISLYPPPSSAHVTTTSGLAFYGSRDVTEFVGTVATAVPGFAKQFHRILSYSAAIDFEQDPQKVQQFLRDKEQLIKGLKRFYGKRHIERPSRIRSRDKKFRRKYL